MLLGRHYPMKSDVVERKNEFLLNIDLPGCRKEDIKASVEDGYLNVSASLHKDTSNGHGRYVRRECYSGEFTRSFYLGDEINEDAIKASYRHGVLRIEIPKDQKAITDSRIAIQ